MYTKNYISSVLNSYFAFDWNSKTIILAGSLHNLWFAIHTSKFYNRNRKSEFRHQINLNSQITIRNSQFTIRNSQFTIRNSQFAIHKSQFTIHNLQITIHKSQFTIRNSQLKRGTIIIFSWFSNWWHTSYWKYWN